MKKITQRDLIREVAARWARQYHGTTDSGKLNILAALLSLDRQTASPEYVARIIGNDSWTRLTCHECGECVKEVVQIGEEMDIESHTAHVCHDCLNEAAHVMNLIYD